MEYLLQDIIAIGVLLVIGAPLWTLVRDIGSRMAAEHGAMQRGFELGVAGVEMRDFPDSLEGYRMHLGNQLYFDRVKPDQCQPFVTEAKRIAANRHQAAG